MWRETEADGVRVWARTDLDEVNPRQAESCELVAGGGDLQSLALHLVHLPRGGQRAASDRRHARRALVHAGHDRPRGPLGRATRHELHRAAEVVHSDVGDEHSEVERQQLPGHDAAAELAELDSVIADVGADVERHDPPAGPVLLLKLVHRVPEELRCFPAAEALPANPRRHTGIDCVGVHEEVPVRHR